MYYTGVDPRNMQPVYVATNPHEKAMQRALIQYRNPKNYDLVVEALTKAGRTDLIGFDKKCLIRPRKGEGQNGAYHGNFAGSGNGSKKGGGSRGNVSGGKSGANAGNSGKKKTIRNVHKKKGK